MSEPKMPDTYQPTILRPSKPKPRDQVVYACGYAEQAGSYAMFRGPFPDLVSALEVVPEEDKYPAYVIRFNEDGTDDVIYRWDSRQERWYKIVLR